MKQKLFILFGISLFMSLTCFAQNTGKTQNEQTEKATNNVSTWKSNVQAQKLIPNDNINLNIQKTSKLKLAKSSESIEIIEKRDAQSRTFLNNDGSFTKVQTNGYLHYKDANGNWISFDGTLTQNQKNSNVYEVTKTDLPITIDVSTGKTIMALEKNQNISFGDNVNLIVMDKDFNEVNKIVNNKSKNNSIKEKEILLKNSWTNIDRQQEVDYWYAKSDYVINSKPNYNNTDGYLLFEDKIELPTGWQIIKSGEGEETVTGWQGDLIIMNSSGKEVGRFHTPIYYESSVNGSTEKNSCSATKKESDVQNINNSAEKERAIIGSYRLKESGGKYTLSVVVPLNWLLSADRTYPVTIDPTASNTYASGNIASCYYPTFNSVNMDVTIPAGSTVTATNSQCTYIAVSPSKRKDGWIGFQSGSNLDGYWYCNVNSAGTCNVTGTSNSTIANGTYSNGTVPFTLKVSRDNPSGSCNTTYLYVSNSTWIETVTYCTVPGAPALTFPANNANVQPGKVTHFTWNAPTTGDAAFTYTFYFYNGASWQNWNCDTNRYIDLQLLEYNSASWCGFTAQWYVKATNSCGNTNSSTWNLIPYPKYSGSTTDYTITPTSNCQSSGAHSIIQGGADYYSFNATAGNTYYFSTCSTDLGCGTNTGWDTYLKIYGTDGSCTTSAYNDDGGSCTHYESFINGWTCSTTGTYYVQITGYNSSAYGTYYLQYKGTCPTLTANLTGGSSPICYNTAPVMFTATGSGGSGTYTYLWYLNGSSTGITTQTYTAPALTTNATIYCAVSSCGQTANTSTTNITVNPLPIAEAGNDTTITAGDSIQIGSNPVSGYAYLWSPATGLSSSTVANPVAFPDSTIVYYLTITDVNSCVAWDSVNIIVLPPDHTTKLINSDCGATGINFDQTLTAFEVQGANFYLFHIINSSLNFSEQIIKNSNTFTLSELNTQIYFNTIYKIAVSVIIGTDTITPIDTCFITTFDPDHDINNYLNQVIYDRFGNTYTLDEITRKPDDPNSFSVIAGRFWLDFTDPVIYTPQVVATITQVFDDLDVLITSQSCGTNLPDDLPYVYIQINAPTGMDPGNPGAAISSSFYAPLLQACCNPNIENSGVLESEVWRAINTGINNPVLFDGVINLNFFSPNWTFNTDLFTPTTVVPAQIDLYTVVLHETMHLLGFASLISSTGTSILAPNNMYSRYDLFLNDNLGVNFIDWPTPYTTVFNVPLASLNANCTNIRFQGTHTIDEPITNINSGMLSHIDDNCLVPPITEVMKPGISYGEENRLISPRDANILLDLGYQLSGTFGDGTLFQIMGLPSGGPGVIGRPDGLNGFNANCANNYQLELCNPGTDQIVINDISPNTFLTNDIHAVGFEGLELLQGNATFVENHTTNQITVTPNASGLITFRYVPIDLLGNRGNYTCIYINVTSCQTCLHPDDCNLVCNPNMQCVEPPCSYAMGSLPQNWMSSHGSPDWDNQAIIAPPDPGYIRMGTYMVNNAIPFSEGVMTTLSQSIIINHTYIFSYYRRRFADYPYSIRIDQVFVKLFSSTNTAGIIPTIIHEEPIVPLIPGTSQLILEENNIDNTDWEQVVVCFTSDGNYDRLWIYPQTQVVDDHGVLYIDRVQLAPFNPNFAGTDVTSACANNVTIGTDMCSVDNMQFEWTQVGVPGVIGNTEQIQVPGDVTPTPTYQLEFVPLLPNPNTVVFPVGGNLCQTTDQVNVNFTAGMSVNTNINNASCNTCNGSATVAPFNGIPPYQYIWDAQAGGGTTSTATNLCTGNYQVTITDNNACTLIQNIAILQQMALTVTSVNPSCNGGSNGSATVTPSCGTSPYTYSWNTTPVQTTSTATALTAGTWQVTVTDANGISVSAAVTLATSAVTAIPSHTNVSCNGGSNGSATVTSSGGTSPYTYSWNTTPVQTTATATALTAGTWNVTVTDANLCTATASVTITQPVITISLTTTQTNVSCTDGSTGIATVTATGGTPPYSYDWSPNGFTGDGTDTYSNLIAGVYSITVTDANNGCATVNVTITQPATALTASTSSQINISCFGGNNGSAIVTATGGTTTYSYDWSPNGFTGDGTDTYSGLIAGVYDVTVTDANSCTATSTVTITEPAALTATTTPTDLTCNSVNTGAIDLTVTNGTSPYTYSWTGPGTFTANTEDIANLTLGTYNATVIDANSCTWAGNATVIEDIINANWPAIIPNTSGDEQIYDMAYDEQGNIYAIGLFNDNITLPDINNIPVTYTSSIPDASIFVAKYDYCGNLLYGYKYGTMISVVAGPWDCHIEYIHNTNPSDDKVVVTGQFAYIDFTTGGYQMYDNNDGGAVFLAYLDPVALHCTPTQQIMLNSPGIDYVKGLSVNGSSAVITGVFPGGTLNIAYWNNVNLGTIPSTSSYLDIYLARFDLVSGDPALIWGNSYTVNYPNNVEGLATEFVSPTDLYFTYACTSCSPPLSYIVKIDASTGNMVGTPVQIGTGTDYFEINDMASYSGVLYLCGFHENSYGNTSSHQAAVISYFNLPNITWNPTNSISAISTPNPVNNTKNTANKIVANSNGVYVAGTFGIDQFSFDPAMIPINALTLYGNSNHYVTKFDASLGWIWQTGVLSGDISRATSLVYDSQRNMYYVGGSFSGTVLLISSANHFIGPSVNNSNDAFIARFEDIGTGANYKLLNAINDSLNKRENTDIILYPNPSNGKLIVKSENNKEAITGIVITDITGRIVYERNINDVTFEIENDLSFLSANTYIVKINTISNSYNRFFVVVK